MEIIHYVVLGIVYTLLVVHVLAAPREARRAKCGCQFHSTADLFVLVGFQSSSLGESDI